MQTAVALADVKALIRGFRGAPDRFPRQYGVRHAKTALQLWDANREVAEDHYWRARAVLPAAKAAR
jgi:hypothetical protein